MIRLLIIIVLIVLVLSYFHIDLRGIVESPTGQANFSYLGNLATQAWHNYLAPAWSSLQGPLFDLFGKIWPK